MVLSWDHLSTKVVLGPTYRRILVWTELQRQEVLSNYPWYHAEQIEVVGIPHYDLYFQPTNTSRRDWCARYGLDVSKRTLVYYSMPQGRHGSQHLILEGLAAAIAGGVELPANLQILIKCHPFDDPTVYNAVCNRYPFVRMLSTTLPAGADPMNWLPGPGEISVARDCLAFADVTTNIYSTVTIEAALFDKPIVHIAFDAAPLPPGRVPCREYYNFTHFRPIVETNASALAFSQSDLHRLLSESLANPGERRAERRELAARFLGPMDGRSSERVVAELGALLATPDADRRTTVVPRATQIQNGREF
jgi:CDP-glycerol glycerophosphotransferase (TagB/SpsB family)